MREETQTRIPCRLPLCRIKCYDASMQKLTDLTVAQRKRVADLAGTNDGTVRHIQVGRRRASADMAVRLVDAARRIGVELRQEDLCEACGGCKLAKIARRRK